MKWLNRLRCELQDHIRVTEENAVLLQRLDRWQPGDTDTRPLIRWAAAHLRGCPDVTRCTRGGWTSRRNEP